jgi:4-carboxymuconolactone decarboxylase
MTESDLLRTARRQGWTEEELAEVLLHFSAYIGVPLIREAMLTASRIFGEIGREADGSA